LLVGEGSQGHVVGSHYYKREFHDLGVDALTAPEVGALAASLGLPPVFAGLHGPTGGLPGLVVPALEDAARAGVGIASIEEQAASPESPFAPVFAELRAELGRDREAAAFWKALTSRRSSLWLQAAPEVQERLFRLGLVVFEDGGGVGARCPLFAKHVSAP
jgi:hypothetical protein